MSLDYGISVVNKANHKEVILVSDGGVEVIAKYRVLSEGLVKYEHIDERIAFVLGDFDGKKFKSLDFEITKRTGRHGIRTYNTAVLYLIDEKPLNAIIFEDDGILKPNKK